jgi:hypothetical protein
MAQIYVREDGQTRAISHEEWDAKNPGREPYTCGDGDEEDDTVFDLNITHNLSVMASEAGIYNAVWRPDENGITQARQLIPILENGIAKMEADPERFRKHNPPNGWGNYEVFLPWLKEYLNACRMYPDATVSVSR